MRAMEGENTSARSSEITPRVLEQREPRRAVKVVNDHNPIKPLQPPQSLC